MTNGLSDLLLRHPPLAQCADAVERAFSILLSCYRAGGKVLICGNGGSAADAEHIAGELLKSFRRRRPVAPEVAKRLPPSLTEKLEGALPAVSLVSMCATMTAFANDVAWETVFAQQVLGLGKAGDVLVAISTSGNSADCVAAAQVAKALDMSVVALTGADGGRLATVADATVAVPERETFKVQELHLPVYHALCAALEQELFP